MLPELHDYPAAHSMDTTWFAVDRDGYVAEFFSSESGAVPAEAASENKGITLEKVLDGLPETGVTATLPLTEAARHGLYSYGHPLSLVAEAYVRDARPPQPVTLDQLSEEVREAVGQVRFTSVSFREARKVQPVELVEECFAWRSAYLNSEGTTLRVIPGQEGLYELEYEELCENYPEYTVEPLPSEDKED